MNTLAFNLSLGQTIQFERLDEWLFDGFQLLKPLDYANGCATSLACYQQFLIRGFALYLEVLQAGGIPLFTPPKVIELTELKPLSWFTQIEVEFIPFFSQTLFEKTLVSTFKVLIWMNENAVTETNRQQLIKHLQTDLYHPIQKIALAGVSTLPLLKTAHELGIPFCHLGSSIYRIGYGKYQRIMDRSSNEKDSVFGLKFSENKFLAARLMRQAGLPAPEHQLVSSFAQAQTLAHQMGWPLVIKPIAKDRGEGVTVDIDTLDKLKEAFENAKKVTPKADLLLEKQVPGHCHRLLINAQRLVYAVKRLPRSVQGTGQETVKTLIEQDAALQRQCLPWKQKPVIPLDAETLACLQAQNLSLESTPAKEQWVAVRRMESTQWGGRDEEVSQQIHPDNLELAVRVARLFNLDMAGIDMITTDISVSWTEQSLIINEVNYAPMFGAGAVALASMKDFYPHFLTQLGYLPIFVYVGAEQALQQAKLKQQALANLSQACYLTHQTQTLRPNQSPYPLKADSLSSRVEALLADVAVEALILVIQTDELLKQPLKLAVIEQLVVFSSETLTDFAGQPALESGVQNLIETLAAKAKSVIHL